MPKVHIVGQKNSFTFKACKNRYGIEPEFISHSHADLVAQLLEKKILIDESSIVPLWNSNCGTVDMDKMTKTAKIFLGEAGAIVDLWPEEIVFELGVKDDGELIENCDIYSVKVAEDQCSRFLKGHSVYKTIRFKGENTTTDAAISFGRQSRPGDGLLCSNDLLSEKAFVSKGNCANPYNSTVFSTIGLLPVQKQPGDHAYSLGCVLANVNGDTLPVDFINYWQQLFPEQVAEGSTDILKEIPKILFILRHEEAKALLLLEMMSSDLKENPWPIPEVDKDSGFELTNEMASCDQVGGLLESYAATESELFIANFKISEKDVVFYGSEGTFFWGAPALKVFVHGFDMNLVKECVKLQIKRMVQLLNYGINMPPMAEKLLRDFEANEQNLRLSRDSHPDLA